LTIDSSRNRSRCIDFTAPFRLEAEAKPVRRRPGRKAVLTGAVRIDAHKPVTSGSTGHAPKMVAGLMLVASGILVTTASIGRVTPAIDVDADSAAGNTAGKRVAPAFFFDDASDALGDRQSVRTNEIAAPLLAEPVVDDAVAAVPETNNRHKLELASIATADQNPRADSLEDRQPEYALPASTLLPPPATAHDSDVVSAPGPRTVEPSTPNTINYVIARGDTLSGVLNDHGVKIERMPPLLENDIVKTHLSNLEIGQVFQLTRLANGDFHSIKTKVGSDLKVTIRAEGNDFAIATIDLPVERKRVVSSGTIDQSLYIAAELADLKQSTIMSLADIFQWELDFARDIRQGDQFAVVYDRLYREGEYIGDGEILAAEFVRGGRTHRAIRFTDENDNSGYYAPDGTSKRRTFLRHPVDVVRITSKFDPKRLHPVLHKIRAHRGVDYGAPYGSPIRATADGVIKFAGSRNAYGNTVILQHGDSVKTLYAHMSRISDKSSVGARVNQGDVIGYVGNSGRVTGTHLHYEFRVDEKHVDPLTVELPAAKPLESHNLEALRARADEMIVQMKTATPATDALVASTNARPSQ